MEVKSFISLDEAIRKGIKHKPKLTTKSVSVLDAVGKYSASDILSASDYPAFDRSAVDGYAVRSDETISSSKTNPSTFIIVGTVYPSTSEVFKVGKGEAIKIMTGSKIPKGSDSVVMLEDVKANGEILGVFVPVRKFQNVSRRGEDIKSGFRIIGKGKRVTPPHVAALLECGITKINVVSVSIGILSTGDELVSGDVKNSTQPMLQSFLRGKGFEVSLYGVARDDEDEIERALKKIREDIVIVTGGTGPGEKDIMPRVIERHGKIEFRGMRIRPGRTTSFGTLGGKPIFLVSGLPVAALISTENLIIRLIFKWFGLSDLEKEYRTGVLARSVVNTLGFKSFVRVKVVEERNGRMIYPTRVTGSGVIYSMIDADGILVLDENSEGIEEGNTVSYEVLRW